MTFEVAMVVFWVGAIALALVFRDERRLIARAVWLVLMLASILAAYLHTRSSV